MPLIDLSTSTNHGKTPSIQPFNSMLSLPTQRSSRTNETSLVVGRHDTKITRPARSADGSSSALDCRNSIVNIEGQPEEENLSFAYSEPIGINVKFHESRTSTENVLLDPKSLPGSRDGDVAELEPFEGPSRKKLIFQVRDSKETRQVCGGNQISILSGALQTLMDLKPRSQVLVSLRSKADCEADLIEIFIKDIYLSRGDMWNLSSQVCGKCFYRSQRVLFLDQTIRGTIHGIYKRGKKSFSGYAGEKTKIVFRSESARLIFLIQISREMWHFEETGEPMFQKLINSLLPKIFKVWKEMGTHHLITIALFTSIDLGEASWSELGPGEKPQNVQDYYRVVVDQVNIVMWGEIMASLRYEFANFMKDIMLKHDNEKWEIKGRFLPASKANLLEAINTGLSLVVDHFRDPDLRHTTNHFVVVSPGTGIFDVDYDLMVSTSRKMLYVDSAIDLICLSQPPMHVVPIFRYKEYGKVQCCVPSWLDVSFWNSSNNFSRWVPRCKMYEFQMMGVMGHEERLTSVEKLEFSPSPRSVTEAMDLYDEEVFKKEVHQNKARIPQRRSGILPLSNLKSNALTQHFTESKPLDYAEPTISTAVGFTNSRANVSALSALLNLSKGGKKTPFVSRTPSPSPETHERRSDAASEIVGTPTEISLFFRGKSSEEKFSNKKKTQESDIAQLWTVVENPSKSLTVEGTGMLFFGRWQHVFPPKVKRRAVKWVSLSSPASLPVTTSVFPTPHDFRSNYNFQIYDVILNCDDAEKMMTSADLMREMISLRLTLGFQICTGERVRKVEGERKPGGDPQLLITYIPKQVEGCRIYMCLDDNIHRISCDYHGNVNVQVYHRSSNVTMALHKEKKPYLSLIRTRYDDEYRPARLDTIKNTPKTFNWNQLDQLLAGYDDAMEDEKKHFNRIKFVVLPADIPKSSFGYSQDKLSAEEIRLEGLRKLISVIYRQRYISPEEGRRTGNKGLRRDEVFPDVNFYTGNLFSFLSQQAETYKMTDNKQRKESLFFEPETRLSLQKDVKLPVLAQHLQSKKGINFVDRRWHWKTHVNCFLGQDLVSWLIENFEGIHTRVEAVEFGNKLMEESLFQHVEKNHSFLDGHYFYQLSKEYVMTHSPKRVATKDSDSSWFSKQKDNQPSPVLSARMSRADDRSSRLNFSMLDASESHPTSSPEETRKVILSRSLTVNCDPNGKSYKPELVTVHYDRVHNPDHCFHIRLEWLNNTSKLIEDTITSWSRQCESYGLKLVETPWNELCTLPTKNPFHSIVEISLSLNPWQDPEFNPLDDGEYCAILKQNVFFYHMYLLEVTGFLLDNRAALFFQDDSTEIFYSWGKPKFKFVQYIHKTGTYIAEIRDTGELVLAPNNTHIARVNLSVGSRDSQKNQDFYFDSQKVMLDFRFICQNSQRLREIFREARTKWLQGRDLDETLFNKVE